ncbi:ATP-binding protein [uncultured Kordia sp.]|uniref:sensor histidine kinase n=1 Tax=uncultured Kordia sp. TaxID=507699 RepID=UPI002628CD9A|nr:ATP-binding protein [uncultured Kordia sp.]
MEIYTKHIIAFSQIGVTLLVFGLYAVAFVFLTGRFNAEVKNISNHSAQVILNLKEEYLQKLIHFQEEDRKRLSEELHDNVMSRFHLMRLNLLDGDIELLHKNLKTSMKIIRALSHNFAPMEAHTDDFSLMVEDYISQIEDKIQINYTVLNSQTKEKLSASVKLNMFRIFQELISNILKHSKATEIEIQFRNTTQSTILFVKDNGCGFNPEKTMQGIGLKNIQYRAEIIKSRYKFKTMLGKYTMFIIFIPQYN